MPPHTYLGSTSLLFVVHLISITHRTHWCFWKKSTKNQIRGGSAPREKTMGRLDKTRLNAPQRWDGISFHAPQHLDGISFLDSSGWSTQGVGCCMFQHTGGLPTCQQQWGHHHDIEGPPGRGGTKPLPIVHHGWQEEHSNSVRKNAEGTIQSIKEFPAILLETCWQLLEGIVFCSEPMWSVHCK